MYFVYYRTQTEHYVTLCIAGDFVDLQKNQKHKISFLVNFFLVVLNLM